MSRWTGHDSLCTIGPVAGGRSHRAPGASPRLQVDRRPVARWRRVGPGPAPGPARAVGGDGPDGPSRVPRLLGRPVRRTVDVPTDPTTPHAPVAGPGRRHAARQAHRVARAPPGRLRAAG